MRRTRALAFLLLTIGAFSRVFAADGLTAITGVAVDAQGLALPGVTVTLRTSGAAGDPQEQITDAEGRFTFDALAPGMYSIVLSLSGFEDKTYAVAVPAAADLKAVMQIAGVTETVVVRPELPTTTISIAAVGEAVIEQRVLSDVPLASERFEDALPLLPGVVRGPDGLLNMNGARADQSALLLNGLNMTDPVTGHFSARLPLEAIETMNVHAGVYSAAFGNATGGVTDIVVRRGQDKVDFQIQNVVPRLRFNDGLEGVNAFTPRVRIAGPIQPGRMWFSQAMSYRFVRTQVEELSPRGNDEQKVKSFDSVTQIDRTINSRNHLSSTFVVFPSNIDNAGIDTLHPYDATPDLQQRAWTSALTERAILSDSKTLSLTFATKQYDMNVLPKYDAASLVTVSGTRHNYFNHFDRSSKRYDASGTLAIAVPNAWGQHLFRTGGQWARTSYDGVDISQPVVVTGADGSPLRRIDFIGSGQVGASNIEMAGFLEDEWAVSSNLTLHGGARYGYEQIGGEQTIAPRLDASYRPFRRGGTVVKGGYGQLYDKLPLNAADFTSQQTRVVTEYDANGAANGMRLFPNRVTSDGLQTPATRQWNMEVDQRLAPGLIARVGYRQSRGSDQLIVNPTGEVMLLSSDGRSRSNEIETTIRRQFGNAGHITASYVHASAKGNLNDFVSLYGDMRDPVIRPDEYARQSFDVPDRFLFWSVLNLPKEIVVSPTLEYRTGFPYSVIDEQQKTVGARNEGGRYPNLFTLDLSATKIVKLTKTRRARVGMQVFNLTNHFNPQDVQNNTGSPAYGQYANSVDRQVRTKFTLLFEVEGVMKKAILIGLLLATPALQAAEKKESASMPIVAEHKYRMLAKVRPVLFWVTKDDVGGARISWRGDEEGGYGLDLLIGSDPRRAPRGINKWGYIAEQVQGSDARVIGVMKQANEQSVADAESQLSTERRGGYAYRAIQGTTSGREARADVTTVRVERDLTFRDIGSLLEMVGSSKASGELRSVALPNGTRPGFLVALRDLIKQSADRYAQQPAGGFKPSPTTASYVYFGTFYDLSMKSSELVKNATIDGRKYTNVARSDFEVRNRHTGETTRFQLTYGTSGALAGVPIHAVYQPRWWFEVQLFLDENTAF